MTFQDYLSMVVVDGADRAHREQTAHTPPWAGALAAYEACLVCRCPAEIEVLLTFSSEQRALAVMTPVPDLDLCVFSEWFEREMIWVSECVAALLLNEGHRGTLRRPSSRAVLKCAELLGVAPGGVPLEPQRFLDSPAVGTPDCLCSFCGGAIDGEADAIVLRAWDQHGLELRACARAACARAFLVGVRQATAEC